MGETTYYKVLDPDGHARMGTGTWHLPKGKRPGKWMPALTGIRACQRGYHVATIGQILDWLGPCIYTVECRGEHIDAGDKHVFGQARLLAKTPWDQRTARLFAADCAEHVLHIFEKHQPGDYRPRKAIEVARLFANGEATDVEWAAAAAAAGDAAWDAARDAAWDAAGDAAGAAAWAAAGAAAAAAAAAAARDAAWAAAGDAAWDAAGDAAGDAEREWQHQRLAAYLRAEVTVP